MRIVVTPDNLYSLANQVRQAASQLREAEGRVGRAMGGLDWESRHKLGVEGMVNAARSQACRLMEQADGLARFLTERARAFEQTDQELSAGLGSAVGQFHQINFSTLGSRVESISQGTRRLLNLGNLLHTVAATAVVGASMVPGFHYAGEVIINLPDVLRQIEGLRKIRETAFLAGHLTHFSYTNLPSMMLGFGVATSVPVIIGKLSTDLAQYRGTDLASAVIVDTAFTLAPVAASFVTSQTITWGATALGTVLFPGPGSVAGYAVGTAVTTFVFGNVASISTQMALGNEGVRESAIAAVDSSLESVISNIQSGYQQLLPASP